MQLLDTIKEEDEFSRQSTYLNSATNTLSSNFIATSFSTTDNQNSTARSQHSSTLNWRNIFHRTNSPPSLVFT